VGVGGFGRGEVGRVDGKEGLTFTTVMNGITQNDFDGATGKAIAEVMQQTLSDNVLSGEILAVRTSTFVADTRAMLCLGGRQIGRIDDSFGRVGNIFTGTGHAVIEVLNFKLNAGSLTIFSKKGKGNPTTTVIHSRKKSTFFVIDKK
jgi:hypothetical protein